MDDSSLPGFWVCHRTEAMSLNVSAALSAPRLKRPAILRADITRMLRLPPPVSMHQQAAGEAAGGHFL